MAAEIQNIAVTVKVPFGGDRTVTTQPLVTVKELTATIMATCDTESFRDVPQCIVQSGRILPESSTLQQAGVSNGAVLHLMRRPREDRTIPGRGRSRHASSTDDPNSGEASEAPPDDDDDDHDHDAEHHVHTNVIIGHIAVDGRIRYSDAYDMLLSVLHAVGFSTRAVRSAAAVAAAIAVATQSSEERGGASRTVLQNAWQGTRRLQEQLSRERMAALSDTVDRIDEETQHLSDEVSPPAPTRTEESAEASASMRKEIASGPAREPEQARSAEASRTPNGAGAVVSDSQMGAPSSVGPSRRTVPALLPEEAPATQAGETDLQASGSATDSLLPVLADVLEVAASRLRSAPSMVHLEGSDRLEAAEMLTEQLGSVASVVTVVTTLVSTLLPDPDDLRTTNRSDRSRHNEDTEGSGQNPRGDTGASETADRRARSVPNGNTNASAAENGRQGSPQRGRTEAAGSNGSSTDSRNRNSSRGENASRSGAQLFGMFTGGGSSQRNQGASGSNRRIRRSRRVRVSSSQAANADFMIRVLSYYFCSLCDIRIPAGSGPPEVEGQTAISVLDGLYGANSTARPANTFLRLIHFAMQKLTPRQFHEICRGNMAPLARIRLDLWEEISRLVRRHHGPVVERGHVKELFVDHICEALHEFVHVLESADEANEDGVFTPGPEDFCHHIMHTIQRKMELFANILAIRRSEEEFSGRMSRFVKGAVGEILLAIAMELEMQWDGLLKSIRRAAYEIGKTVVGSQFSVIFPYIANLFARRAEVSYQRSASRHPEAHHTHADRSSGHADTNGELDHSNCGPGCERHQATLDEGSASHSHDSEDEDLDDYSHDYTDSDMPELGDQDSEECSYDATVDDMCDGDSDADVVVDTRGGTTHRQAMFRDLDDAELRELANELETEAEKTELSTSADLGDVDFETMASELAAEADSSIGKSPAEAPEPSSKPMKLPTEAGKEKAKRSAGDATRYVRAASVNPLLSTSGALPSSSVSRAAFSSAAVPRDRGSSTSSAMKNDFERILGPQDGPRWKQVIDRDQVRVHDRQYGPLSRGYHGETSVAQPLDVRRGSELAAVAAKEAAKQAKLSPEHAIELERVASESGSQYMKEMERAIESRLRSDRDFNRQRFPRSAERFLPKGP